jgi:hypothetical protein
MFLVDCIKCLLWSEHHSIQIYLITFFEIIKFCMLLQQEINVPGLSDIMLVLGQQGNLLKRHNFFLSGILNLYSGQMEVRWKLIE